MTIQEGMIEVEVEIKLVPPLAKGLPLEVDNLSLALATAKIPKKILPAVIVVEDVTLLMNALPSIETIQETLRPNIPKSSKSHKTSKAVNPQRI